MSNKLNILFLCGWYPSKVLPNNGDFIERHALAVSKKCNVTVVHIISDENQTKEIEIVSRENQGIKEHIAYLKSTENPILKSLLFLKAFFKLLKLIPKIEVVHLNEIYPFGIFSLYLKWFQKKPFLISEHFTGYHQPKAKKLSLLRIITSKIITKNASFICPVSNDLANSLQKLNFKGTYKRVPNVVDTSLFKTGLKSNKFTIHHISNMDEEHKNISGILRVISKLQKKTKNFHFKIIGENAIKYKAYANELQIKADNISFIDHITHKEVAKELRESSLFILFSNYENLPCVILEAFASGTPVISTNVGGINEFFPKEFGKLIPKNDEKSLLENILKIQSNYNFNALKMHAYVEDHFSYNMIAKKFVALYKRSLNQ